MRDTFIDELTALAETHPQIALIVGDLGFNVIEPFADRFPDRFINAGVAEQNMTGLAAGMASEGYHVFTYSIANFPTFRCAEQIRNTVDYHRLAVTVVAVGAGLAYGASGYSHHAVQDYALMRAMPGMTIAAPGDLSEVRACLRWLVANPGPSYLRLGKVGNSFHADVPDVGPGRWVVLRDAEDMLLSTGAALEAAVERAQATHCGYGIATMPLWSMASKQLQPEILAGYRNVVTLEDHVPDGGFGSWMMEAALARPELLPRIRAIALDPVVCGMVGTQATLNRAGGLTPAAMPS